MDKIGKRYVTLFPECEPVHLKKDVGMLPYSLGKYEGYESGIVCYRNENFTEEQIRKFNIKFVDKKSGDIKDFSRYLLKNGKNIDCLNIYHLTSQRNVYWIMAYKFINPRGKIHMKLDADYRMVEMANMEPSSLKGKIRVWLLKNKVDLYTVENRMMKDILEPKWKIKMELLPNGIFREEEIKSLDQSEKENVFLTVGRLGNEQKATEDILDAYKRNHYNNWKLWLVGPMEKKFEEYLEKYFLENPELKDKITVYGNIDDEEKLTNIYRKASVFILPSKWESFGLVLLEALECGNYLIVSDKVPSADDIGRNGEYVTIVPYHDIDLLSKAMLEATLKTVSNKDLNERKKWIEENYTWKVIVEKLNRYLLEL